MARFLFYHPLQEEEPVLNTSVALDSPSVMGKFLTPPHTHATHTATTVDSKTFDTYDAVSTMLDKSSSLGPFLDATIARTIAGNAETPNEDTTTPVSSPESSESYDIEDGYVEMTDEFIKECKNTHDRSAAKSLLERRTIRPKLSPDAKFAASPINIIDEDYDFSLDLSYITIVEKEPFCGSTYD